MGFGPGVYVTIRSGAVRISNRRQLSPFLRRPLKELKAWSSDALIAASIVRGAVYADAGRLSRPAVVGWVGELLVAQDLHRDGWRFPFGIRSWYDLVKVSGRKELRFMEVKTTEASQRGRLAFTGAELEKAIELGERYVLSRVRLTAPDLISEIIDLLTKKSTPRFRPISNPDETQMLAMAQLRFATGVSRDEIESMSGHLFRLVDQIRSMEPVFMRAVTDPFSWLSQGTRRRLTTSPWRPFRLDLAFDAWEIDR